MAAQNGLEIPFSSSHAQQSFKLLELPSELLALLESENPPTIHLTTCPTTSLALLTAPSSSTSTTPPLKYRIQQKNSSNPLLILSPTTTRASIPKTTLSTEEPALTTIAKIEDTLELLEWREEEVVRKVNKWHEKFAKGRKK